MSEREAVSGDERVRQLLMSALDGELNARERQELERLLDADLSLRDEWNRLTRVKEVTQSMSLRKPPDEVWEDYWASVYSRLERGIGWILVSIGLIVLVSYGAWRGVEELISRKKLTARIRAASTSPMTKAFNVLLRVRWTASTSARGRIPPLRNKLCTRRRGLCQFSSAAAANSRQRSSPLEPTNRPSRSITKTHGTSRTPH